MHFGIARDNLPFDNFTEAWRTAPIIDGLRSGRLREISWAMIGLVSFPSFHAASAILFGWAGWHIRWSRFPLIALNAAMLVSTVVVGAHHFIDIPGGIAVAALSLWLGVRLVRSMDQQTSAKAGASLVDNPA